MTTMTLRDYFAAHAPAEPQPWFEPVLSRPWSKPPAFPTGLDAAIARQLESWRKDPSWDLEMAGPTVTSRDAIVVVSYVSALQAHWASNDALKKEQKAQRFIQWPYAWADAQLAERLQPRAGTVEELHPVSSTTSASAAP